MPPNQNESDPDSTIGYEQRRSLISNHPLFNNLSPQLIDELTKLTFEKKYDRGEIVVSKDEIIKAIYFITKGEVEVDREVKDKGYCLLVPQAILREGETIGINHEGFSSESGLHTATLKTLSECILIGWDLDTFNSYLKNHPVIYTSMRQGSEIMQRINFIKQVEPFATLPKERLSWLSTHIQEINVVAGTVLFHIGDIGEECYLVRTGEVEITIPNRDGTEKKLATLVPPMLFGETALLTSSKRNATAKMTQTGKLLVIKKDQLNELMQHHSTTESMMLLSLERCRPIHAEGIENYHRKSDEGEKIVILKDKLRGKYFQLSEDGWFIWQHLDGTNTLQDLSVELFKSKRVFCPEAIADTIFNLADAGFVYLPEVPILETEISKEIPSWQRLLHRFRYIEFFFDNIDGLVTATFNRGVFLLYSWFGRVLMILSIFVGALAFALFAPEAFVLLQATNHLLAILIILIVANLLSVLLHEMAHAYTTKYFKHEVRRAGILFSWLNFRAFVDTSDMWLSDKRSKILVSLAGPIADLTVAGILSLVALLLGDKDISLFLWLLALVLYYGVLKNLNPLMENDGYFVMKDYFENNSLRAASIRRLFGLQNRPPQSKDGEVIYLVTCAIFMLIDLSLAFVFQHYLSLLFPSMSYLVWLLPALILAKYILTITILYRRLK